MRRRVRSSTGRALLGPAVLVLGLLAAACGGSSGGDGTGVASAGNAAARDTGDDKVDVDPQQAGLDFARCMREHGVDMPDPQGGEGGMVLVAPGAGEVGVRLGDGPPPGFEEADKACRHIIEDLVQDGGGPVDPEDQDRALKFAQCMREHGIDMPDPDFSKGGIQIQIREGVEPGSEAMVAAHKACGSLFGPGDRPAPGPAFGVRS